MTIINNQLSEWTKKLQSIPKAKPEPKKKVMVAVWWSAANLIHYSFLNPSEIVTSDKYAQQISEMHEKLHACSQDWSTERAHGPFLSYDSIQPHVTQPRLQNLNELGYKILSHLHNSPYISSTNYQFLKHLDNFLQGKCFHNQEDAENAFQEFIES